MGLLSLVFLCVFHGAAQKLAAFDAASASSVYSSKAFAASAATGGIQRNVLCVLPVKLQTLVAGIGAALGRCLFLLEPATKLALAWTSANLMMWTMPV